MIRVELTHLIMIYLAGLLGLLFAVWCATELARVMRERRVRKNFVICEVCDHVYEDASDGQFSQCPECGRMNERSGVREI